jgi:hypothetical protein
LVDATEVLIEKFDKIPVWGACSLILPPSFIAIYPFNNSTFDVGLGFFGNPGHQWAVAKSDSNLAESSAT